MLPILFPLLLMASPVSEVPIATLLPPDSTAGDGFGSEIVLTENHIVVAAPSRATVGAIYVFDRATRAFLRRIDAPTTAGEFPYSLAAGPASTIIAGHFRASTVYLFNVSTGTLTRTLEPVGDIRNGWGITVLADDTRFVAFNLFEDNGPDLAGGAAYFYSAPSGDFLYSLDQPLAWPNNFSWGNSAHLDGDTMLVGNIYGRSVPSPGAGEAHEVDLTKGTITTVYPDATQGQNLLGSGVLFSPDKTEVLALPGYDDGLPYGWAYLYPRGSATPRLSIRSPQQAAGGGNELFGESALFVGEEILFGAPRRRVDGVNTVGTVYRFSRATGQQVGEIAAPEPVSGRSFGAAMTRDATLLYVGAASSFSQPGRIYIYAITPGHEGWMVR